MSRTTLATLFSDIEGSTRLLQLLGPGYGDLLMTHRRLLRQAFEAHGGTERDREGDSFFVTFATAGDAVLAALDGQRALAAHDWPASDQVVRVRMGIHIGEVELMEDAVIGLVVHEAARLAAAGHGGQVLASAAAVGLAQPLPPELDWVDLGDSRLKDVPEAMTIYQLTHPALERDFPPLRLRGSVRTNLPQQPSGFVGRVAELESVTELMRAQRLVTVTGTGGVGKTRLALRAAADAGSSFADGVFFVDLAQVVEPEGLVGQVARAFALDVRHEPELVAALADCHALLVLDNCEHLVEPVAGLVTDLLTATQRVHVLATSREPLGCTGEAVWRVPPMSQADARALLEQRARAVDADFCLSDANLAAVDDVCQRLDAIPLALELAAARLVTLSIDQVAERLDQRFRLLAGGGRGTVERHRTLQATVDWSYAHLDDHEKLLLAELGVFVGGFPLDGAEAVSSLDDPMDVLDVLDRLVQKSLVLVDTSGRSHRYRLLETIRQYALDRLIAADALAAVRDRHLGWASGLVSGSTRLSWGDGLEQDHLARLDAEQGNLRAAVDWAIDTSPSMAARLMNDAFAWIAARGRSRDWLDAVRELLARDLDPGDRALAQVVELWLVSNTGPIPPELVAEVAATVDQLPEDLPAWMRPSVRAYLAAWSYPSGDAQAARFAIPACTEALDELRSLGPGATATAIQTLVWLNLDAGQLDEARRCADEGLVAAEECGSAPLESRIALHRARVDRAEGDLVTAQEFAQRSMVAARRTGDAFLESAAVRLLADLAEQQGDAVTATDLLASIVDLVARTQSPENLADVVADLERCSAAAAAG